jgi:hypothetical protein
VTDYANITDAQIFDAIRKVAESAPDTVYRTTIPDHQYSGSDCFYVHTDGDGNPVSAGCIIGKALHALGVPLETLREQEGVTANRVMLNLGIGSADAQDTARDVQISQDHGNTWEYAVRYLPKAEATA